MDESKLLEECINISLTPLETILLSKTLITINMLIEFLKDYNLLEIEKITKDNSLAPSSEQTGHILIQSAFEALERVRDKVWVNGSKEIGTEVPEEFKEILSVYITVIQEIAYQFVNSLKER
jgi:hypothetical protein